MVKARRLPCAYVVNTDPSSKPGTHWVAYYFPRDISQPAEFYDTYGQEVSAELRHFLKKYGHLARPMQNTQVVQGLVSSACGQHCIYYLALRCRGWTMDEIVKLFSRTELNWNDSMVTAFVNKHFGLDTEVKDWPFLLQHSVNKIG
jgi:hypothetical protein